MRASPHLHRPDRYVAPPFETSLRTQPDSVNSPPYPIPTRPLPGRSRYEATLREHLMRGNKAHDHEWQVAKVRDQRTRHALVRVATAVAVDVPEAQGGRFRSEHLTATCLGISINNIQVGRTPGFDMERDAGWGVGCRV